MSILRGLVPERRAANLGTLEQILAGAREGRSHALPDVSTPEDALRLSAVWSCVRLYADVVSTLPLHTYRDGANGPERIPDPPLVRAPSANVDRIGWLRQHVVSELLRGNVFGLVQATGSTGWPTQIESINPDDVTVARTGRSGSLQWRYRNTPIERWPNGPLWHLPVNVMPGRPYGLSTIEYARETFGLGRAAQDHGSGWFAGGGHPTAILSTDKPVDETQAKIIKSRFLAATRGRREPAVLGQGMKYDAIQVSAEDSQFLATIAANREQIVEMFFPHTVLAKGASMTYANVEQRSLDMLVYDIQPMLVRYERAITALLPQPQYVKFNTGALVRTSLLDSYNATQIAIRNGWRSANEARALYDEPGIGEQGDQYVWPPAGVPATPQEGSPA